MIRTPLLFTFLIPVPFTCFHLQVGDPVLRLCQKILPPVHKPQRLPPVIRSALIQQELPEVFCASFLKTVFWQDQKIVFIHPHIKGLLVFPDPVHSLVESHILFLSVPDCPDAGVSEIIGDLFVFFDLRIISHHGKRQVLAEQPGQDQQGAHPIADDHSRHRQVFHQRRNQRQKDSGNHQIKRDPRMADTVLEFDKCHHQRRISSHMHPVIISARIRRFLYLLIVHLPLIILRL